MDLKTVVKYYKRITRFVSKYIKENIKEIQITPVLNKNLNTNLFETIGINVEIEGLCDIEYNTKGYLKCIYFKEPINSLSFKYFNFFSSKASSCLKEEVNLINAIVKEPISIRKYIKRLCVFYCLMDKYKESKELDK